MQGRHYRRISLALFGAFFLLLGGCPTGGLGLGDGTRTGSPSGQRGIEAQSTLTVIKTDIPVHYTASVEAGDDLIVFGTGALTGVSYVVPSQQPLAAKAIAGGEFRSSGFALAGRKVLLLMANRQLAVFDSADETLVTIPDDQIYLESLPGDDNQARLGPVAADGQLAITLSRRDEVTDGNALKLVDVSGAQPLITALPNPPVNPAQVAIDATAQRVITYGEDSFYVYDLAQPDAEPQRVSLSSADGIQGPFAFAGNDVLYVARDAMQNIRLLNLTSATAQPLAANPGNRDQPLAVANGRYAYFMRRSIDNFQAVYRSAIGTVGQDPRQGGVADEDPGLNDPSWAGFGLDLALTPRGDWIFISGDLAIDVASEFLQVSNGAEFKAFADGSGYLNATDVDASATLVAFKVGVDQDTRLAYVVLP